jgi:di/tricarboxylate transporter
LENSQLLQNRMGTKTSLSSPAILQRKYSIATACNTQVMTLSLSNITTAVVMVAVTVVVTDQCHRANTAAVVAKKLMVGGGGGGA